MRGLQSTIRFAPRLVASRAAVVPRRSVSMKQPYDTGKAAGMYPAEEGYQRIRNLQTEFSKNPELMVWQKRGAMDSVPMVMTYGAMLAGLAFGFSLLWTMSWPKPPAED